MILSRGLTTWSCGEWMEERREGAAIKAADKCSLTVYRGLARCFMSLLSRSGMYTGWMPSTSVLKDVYGRQFLPLVSCLMLSKTKT